MECLSRCGRARQAPTYSRVRSPQPGEMAPDHWSLIPLEFIFTQPWNSPSWKGPRSDISLSPLPAVSASSSMDCGLQFHCGPQGQQAPFYTQPCAFLGLSQPQQSQEQPRSFKRLQLRPSNGTIQTFYRSFTGLSFSLQVSRCKYCPQHHTEVCCKLSYTVL